MLLFWFYNLDEHLMGSLLGHFEVAMRTSAFRMHHALRNALTIEVRILF